MMDLQEQVNHTDKTLSVHEAVCAERYEAIQDAFAKGTKRMQKIEYLLYAVIASVLLGPEIAIKLASKFLG